MTARAAPEAFHVLLMAFARSLDIVPFPKMTWPGMLVMIPKGGVQFAVTQISMDVAGGLLCLFWTWSTNHGEQKTQQWGLFIQKTSSPAKDNPSKEQVNMVDDYIYEFDWVS